MCGFAGFLGGASGSEDLLRDMARTIRHRGPDDSGVWLDEGATLGLAFARLAILDLSPAGHQPMLAGSGRYVMAFNGEIYNHLALRAGLERQHRAPAYRSHADTETLLAGFDAWGIDETIAKTVGMFAFGVWDREQRVLTLGRDRLGEKPIYYGWQGDTFVFGSEVKALRAHPAFRAEIDRQALTLLMRHAYIPAPYSIYRGIRKLLPGTLLSVSLARRDERPRSYWDARDAVEQGIVTPFRGSPEEAVEVLDTKLREAVRGQMVADVPLGAFLSGGVDSSAIVALMQQVSATPVRTFTIGFREASHNEAEHAKAVARHLGTDHTEMYVTPQQALDVIPHLPSLYCEPFADSSQVPTYLVSQLARRHVTVSLSGDAGDELFAGYNRYVLGQRLWGKLSHVPVALRRVLSRAIHRVPAHRWDAWLGPLQSVLPARYAQAHLGEKMLKGSLALGADSTTELYRLLVSYWTEPGELVIDGTEPLTALTDPSRRMRTDHFVHEMMALDLVSYLPDDILVKVDRAAMGNSLETRVPMLDHRVVEFAWSLPLSYKLRGGVSKWPLREVLNRYVPRELIERPKMGFGVPIDTWLRGPLRDWADDLLAERTLRQQGFFNAPLVQRKWSEHRSGAHNWQYPLWAVLMFQAWLGAQGAASQAAVPVELGQESM